VVYKYITNGNTAVVPQFCSCVYIMLAHRCTSVFGKSNKKTDLLTYRCSFVFEAYRSTIVLRNGNEKFILAPTVLQYMDVYEA